MPEASDVADAADTVFSEVRVLTSSCKGRWAPSVFCRHLVTSHERSLRTYDEVWDAFDFPTKATLSSYPAAWLVSYIITVVFKSLTLISNKRVKACYKTIISLHK